MSIQSIGSNISAFAAQGNIGIASDKASASISRLSSGNRIVKASDDVAGLAVGTSLRTQVNTLRSALTNATQGTSLLQIADGGLGQIIDILQRQKAIATQASSGQLTDANRSLLNQEFTALTAEVDRIANGTNFNGVNLLGGGLGAKTVQVRTNATAVTTVLTNPNLQTATNNAVVAASTVAIQAFGNETAAAPGALRTYAIANAGTLQLVDSSGVAVTNGGFDTIDASVYGQFSNFDFTDVNYGAVGVGSAKLVATLNGVQYTGSVISNATQATAILSNGNTRIQMALGNVTLTDAGAVNVAKNTLIQTFSSTVIARNSVISGVSFEGTRLDGASGIAATGNASIRINTSGNVDIRDFKFVSSGSTANTSIITVQVNGDTWTATGVNDLIGAGTLQFVDNSRQQALQINTTGIANNITNIRTRVIDREDFINALNTGFSKTGSGLNFLVGSTADDSIRVQFGSVASNSIYGGVAIDVNTATNAAEAATVIDTALTKVVSLRATVGALQSRFNFATNAVQSAIENQDAARATFLDTDVSAESTAYATAQVQLQAGIAVLAQANQLPQAFLKLIQ